MGVLRNFHDSLDEKLIGGAKRDPRGRQSKGVTTAESRESPKWTDSTDGRDHIGGPERTEGQGGCDRRTRRRFPDRPRTESETGNDDRSGWGFCNG